VTFQDLPQVAITAARGAPSSCGSVGVVPRRSVLCLEVLLQP
jgi:hypothetical protein